MDMPVPTRSLIDFVLRNDTPVWHKWNGDVSELLDLLEGYVLDYPNGGAPWSWERDKLNYRRIKLIDLLTGEQNRPFFNALIQQRMDFGLFITDGVKQEEPWPLATLVYAWGRRLAAADRHLILDVLRRASEQREHSDYGGVYIAARTAWLETCPKGEPLSLLGWPDNQLTYELLLYEHTEPCIRVTHMLSKLAEISSEKIDRWDNPYSGLASLLKNQLVKDLAVLITPDQSKLPETEDALWVWFLNKVGNILAPEEILILLRSDIRRRLRNDIREVWILAHDQSTWRPLYDSFDILHAGYVSFSAIECFGRILPQDRPELWEKLFTLGSLENFVMQAYCKWLPSEKYHELRRFFEGDAEGPDGEHVDRAVCAYHSYLHRAPLNDFKENGLMWEAAPWWRVMLLDRFLYAPDALKPGPVAWDIQEIEDAYALGDPLDIRGY